MTQQRRSYVLRTDDLDRTERELPAVVFHQAPTAAYPAQLVDAGVLDELAKDLGRLTADLLVSQYRDQLERRLDFLVAAAAVGCTWAFCDMALELAVASATVGAVTLARAVYAVTHEVVRYGTVPPPETLDWLSGLTHDTGAALDGRLPRDDGPSDGIDQR
ncbi:hypothetical protein [Promicromonospora soli]